MKKMLLINTVQHSLILLVLFAWPQASVYAQGRSLAKVDAFPDSKIVLTLIDREKKVKLTLTDIKQLPQHTFFSKSPWYPGHMKMTGPFVRDVLTKYKLTGHAIEALGLDDYKAQIPVADILKYDIVLVHTANDFQLTVKTKGPLWVAYPFDDWPELQSYKHYERSVWQLKSLTMK